MTLPNEILDSLLSGYLDDALTADERARVEQLLQSDADARHELDSMRELREMLRRIDRADRPQVSQFLHDGFSERVVDAAIECARNEGVAEDHPLLRTTEAPSYRRQHSKRGRRLAAVVMALAASGLIGAILFGPEWPGANSNQAAQQQAVVNGGGATDDANLRIADTSEQLRTPAKNSIDNNQDAFANDDVKAASAVDAAMAIADNANSVIAVKESPSVVPQPGDDVMPEALSSVAGVKNTRDVPDVRAVDKPNLTVPSAKQVLLPVFVLDVRRTDRGRRTNPIQSAIKAASIAEVNRKPINEAMVSSLKDAISSLELAYGADPKQTEASEFKGTVIYIEAPAKRIDRLMQALWTDHEGIESVGFNMTMDTPLSNVVRTVEPIATSVQHGQSIEFSGDLDVVSNLLARHLGNRDFKPYKRGAVGLAVEPDGLDSQPSLANEVVDDGPDFMSRVFLLVR